MNQTLVLSQYSGDSNRCCDSNIRQARELYDRVAAEPELEPATQGLGVTTFRYLPGDLDPTGEGVEDCLNRLNVEPVLRGQKGGEAFLSNAAVAERFLLRPCITNFRPTNADVGKLPGLATRLGRELDAVLRPAELASETPNPRSP